MPSFETCPPEEDSANFRSPCQRGSLVMKLRISMAEPLPTSYIQRNTGALPD